MLRLIIIKEVMKFIVEVEMEEVAGALAVVVVEAGIMESRARFVTEQIMMLLFVTIGTLELCLTMAIDLLSFKLHLIKLRSQTPMDMAMLQDHNALLFLRLC
jgi:hypothetical protein